MNASSRTLIIINQTAAKARRVWPHIRAVLRQNRIGFDVHETTRPGDATTATRAALKAGYRTIGVVGGDGTLSEAAAGFFEPTKSSGHTESDLPSPIDRDATLAILPAGTGDDFARGLAGRRESVDEWLKRFVAHCRREGATRIVDLIYGSVNEGARELICLNVVTLGLGAEVARRVAAQNGLMRQLPGEARFVAAACGALAFWRERRVRISTDESGVIECASNLLAVANGIYAGGGMMFAPGALVDDGKVDVLIACGITRATVMRELPRIRRGEHLANKNVRVMTATRVRVETFAPEDGLLIEADGNVRGHTPAEFHVMPRALRVAV